LIARLIGETYTSAPEPHAAPTTVDLDTLVHTRFQAALGRIADPDVVVALTSLLITAGVGPVLPLPVAVAAVRVLGREQSVAHVRDLVVALGGLVSRGKPGLPDEALGIAHTEFLRPLEAAVNGTADGASVAAHRAIASALGELVSGVRPRPASPHTRARPRRAITSPGAIPTVPSVP
jgi:hypothetical protein